MNRLARLCLFVPGVVLAAGGFGADEPTGTTEAPAQVMILGTFHFHNPGLDAVKFEAMDVLSDQRQAEIAAIVDALARFKPTRIAVERVPEAAEQLDEAYRAWRAGERELERREGEQLGFRLAARFDHLRVWPVDQRGDLPFGAVLEYAREHDPRFVEWFEHEIERRSGEMGRQQQLPLARILRQMNDEPQLTEDHGLYLEFGRVGAGTSQVGADLLSAWYDRNIRIHSNLQAIVEPGDRVIFVVGAGHAPILRELVRYDPAMVLVDPLDYLPGQ